MPKGTFNQKFKEPLNKEFLKQHYLTLNKSVQQIMAEFNLSASKIIKAIKRYGIQKPAELKYKKGNSELKTKESLENMYLNEKLSITQIAERLNITTGAVTKLFKSRNIPIYKNFRYQRRRDFTKLRSQRKELKQNVKNLIKEGHRQRIKTGTPCLKTTKSKLRIKAIERGVQNQKRTKSELMTTEILKKLDINFQEQVGILAYQNNICTDGYVADYMISGDKQPIILEVDGDYHHHKIHKNIEKDKNENLFLVSLNFIVIRINSEYISEKSIADCLEIANKSNGCFLINANNTIEKIFIEADKTKKYNLITMLTYNPILKKVMTKKLTY
jgi:very-short-patch-repair endonuclease/predicted DNA-binding protein YlxM (UPF0122 family)